jgi:formylglycine-generating enzyme required for sulfatase activity
MAYTFNGHTLGQFIGDTEYESKFPGEKPANWEGYDKTASPTVEHPVQRVNWYDAILFCNWLSRREELQPCYKRTGRKEKSEKAEYDEWELTAGANGYRLPIGAEWEYACRAMTMTNYACGDSDSDLATYAVFGTTSTQRGASKLCNAWGLFDMHGNVWEWCWNAFEAEGSDRVYRGGSWDFFAWHCRSPYRYGGPPANRYSNLGFRVARGPSSSASQVSQPASGGGSEGSTGGR